MVQTDGEDGSALADLPDRERCTLSAMNASRSPLRLTVLLFAASLAACGARTGGLDDDLAATSSSTSTDAGATPSCKRRKPTGALSSFLSFPTARPGAVDSVTSAGLGVAADGQLFYAYRGAPGGDGGGVFQVSWPTSAGRVSGDNPVNGLAVSGPSRVLWTDSVGLQQFARVGPQAGRPVLARAGIVTPRIAADGAFAYALVDGVPRPRTGGRLVRVDLTTGDERVLAELSDTFRGVGIAVDDTRVYYAQDTFDFLWSVRKDGSESRPKAVQTVAGAPTALAVRGLAFDGSDLFVPMSFTSGLNAWQIAATGRSSTPGVDRRTIPAVGGIEGTVTAVFADRSGVYAAHVPIRGQKGPAWILERYCPDGSFHVELARGDGVVSHIAADTTRLYFTIDQQSGAPGEAPTHIHALPK